MPGAVCWDPGDEWVSVWERLDQLVWRESWIMPFKQTVRYGSELVVPALDTRFSEVFAWAKILDGGVVPEAAQLYVQKPSLNAERVFFFFSNIQGSKDERN